MNRFLITAIVVFFSFGAFSQSDKGFILQIKAHFKQYKVTLSDGNYLGLKKARVLRIASELDRSVLVQFYLIPEEVVDSAFMEEVGRKEFVQSCSHASDDDSLDFRPFKYRKTDFLLDPCNLCSGYFSGECLVFKKKWAAFLRQYKPEYLTGGLKAKPFIFESAFSKDTSFIYEYTYKFRSVDIGNIKIESGRLTVSDILDMHKFLPLAQSLPKGEFPVQLSFKRSVYEIGELATYCRIVFSNSQVDRWELASVKGPSTKKEENGLNTVIDSMVLSPYGFGVIIDSIANHQFNLKSYQEWASILLDHFPSQEYGRMVESDHGSFCEVVGFISKRSSYIGYDKSGKICRLFIDLGTFSIPSEDFH